MIFCALAFTKLNEEKLVLELSISSENDSHLKVYWNKGDGFSERLSIRVPISAGITQKVRLSNPLLEDIQILRIDPISAEGNFSLSKVKVEWAACIIPVKLICDYPLILDNIILSNNVSYLGVSEGILYAESNDPQLVWHLPSVSDRQTNIYALNIGILSIVLCLGFVVLGWRKIEELGVAVSRKKSIFVILLFYPLLRCAHFLSSEFIFYPELNRAALVVTIGVTSFVLWLNQSNKILRIRPTNILLLLVMISALAPDISFHLGIGQRWVYGTEPAEYHWRIGRTFKENYRNSSLGSLKDMREVKKFIRKGEKVLADVATSHYLAASTMGVSVNPLGHHRVGEPWISDQEKQLLCSGTASPIAFKEIIHRLNVRYVLVNHSNTDKNVVNNCLADALKTMVGENSSYLSEVFAGGGLSLFKVEL
jgi:hypothetical protein